MHRQYRITDRIRARCVFDMKKAVLGLSMLPWLICGYLIGKRVRGYLSKDMGRFLMLSIASGGALMLLVKSI